ncbi:MAG: S8 family serine peptidase, partial [Deltaproteobacteria bacterium]|nr:S8 family serine peptidase [Deltaproteobacteria bacterium]
MWRSLLPLVLLLALAPRGRGQEEPRVTVFLALEEPGAVAVRAAVLARGGAPPEAAAAGIRQLHRNRAAQERLRRMLAAAGIPTAEVFPMLRLANGLAVVARGGDLEGLARLPEVRSVQPVALVHRANAFSAPWLGAQAAWSREDVPLTGAGLRVGIIDTGIDYLHADFGGPGTQEAYKANDPESLEEGTFPTAKVAGGWDFAGTEYGYSQEPGVPDKLVPVPDPDPLDQDGHGTHVAGSVAGFGVDAAGATFPGPWDGSFDPAGLRIGPGMAPEATLYALKVFGDSKDSTASALTTAALEWAVDPDGDGDLADRLDVVNISLGADFGIGGGYEKEVYASAVAAGVLVVAAAGNSGDVHLVTSDPCAAEGIVCVASCAHDGTPYPGLWVDAPDSLQGIWLAQPSSYGPALTDQDLTGELTAAEPPLACGPLVNGEALAGRIALVDRGECSFSQKVLAAQAAGALAVVGIHNEDGIPWPSSGNPAGVAIPSVMIRKADGAIFREALSQGPVTLTLRKDLVYFDDGRAGWIAWSSSRGPTRDGRLPRLKPDLTAPGENITSALRGTGSGAATWSGTSMASPTAAGLLTLLRQARPAWEPWEIKAWAMSTASPDPVQWTGAPPLSPARQGAGRIHATRALETELLAYDAEHPLQGSVTFETLDVLAATEEVRTVRVENRGAVPRTFDVA